MSFRRCGCSADAESQSKQNKYDTGRCSVPVRVFFAATTVVLTLCAVDIFEQHILERHASEASGGISRNPSGAKVDVVRDVVWGFLCLFECARIAIEQFIGSDVSPNVLLVQCTWNLDTSTIDRPEPLPSRERINSLE